MLLKKPIVMALLCAFNLTSLYAADKLSKDSLFDLSDETVSEKTSGTNDNLLKLNADSSTSKTWFGSGIKGSIQTELAGTIYNPSHWTKQITRAELTKQGSINSDIKWKLGARFDYDAVFATTNHYSTEVRKDQQANAYLRENYLDISHGNLDFRLGKQNVVWGEMVGMFIADVVSPRDMREFILPEFDQMRIPQWAMRAEYFKDSYHAELLWVPYASYDLNGKPGAEFYPYAYQPAGMNVVYKNENIPTHNLNNTNYGIRLSTLQNGWDVSGFAYSSMDIQPVYYRDLSSNPGTVIYEAKHDRIKQYGGTVAKDFGDMVLKAETVYTDGRKFNVITPTDTDGVSSYNTMDWALGADFTLPSDTRLNVQFYQRYFYNYKNDMLMDKHEDGYSLLLNHKFNDKVEAQIMWMSSLNRTDWLIRPRVQWNFEKNWRLAGGLDVFHGPASGLFGRYKDSSRVYTELRYNF